MTKLSKTENVEFLENCRIIFADREKASNLVAKEDNYTKILTKFDLQAKVKTLRDISSEDYIKNSIRSLYNWEEHEISYLHDIVLNTKKKVEALGLNFYCQMIYL